MEFSTFGKDSKQFKSRHKSDSDSIDSENDNASSEGSDENLT